MGKKRDFIQTMVNPAIDNLVQSSSTSHHNLKWIPCSEIIDIKSTPTDNIHWAIRKEANNYKTPITLVLLGSSEKCTPTVVSEFARIYSLPTHEYENNVSQLRRRYSKWLSCRNIWINGFTKYNGNYY